MSGEVADKVLQDRGCIIGARERKYRQIYMRRCHLHLEKPCRLSNTNQGYPHGPFGSKQQDFHATSQRFCDVLAV